MKSKADITIIFPDEKSLDAALAAIRHEEDFKKRSASKVIKRGNELIISIESLDTVSLRAALNAYLRDFQVIENVEKTTDREMR